MDEWWKRPGVKFHDRDDCWGCSENVIAKRVIPLGRYSSRYCREMLYATVVCEGCYLWWQLETQAQADGARFSKFSRHLCVCGRMALEALRDICVTCEREKRMFEKRLADIRLTAKILTQIRRELAST